MTIQQTSTFQALKDRMANETPMTWSFIGDSITAASWHTFGGRGYVEHFNERLRELGRRTDIVINGSCPGWQVTDLQRNLDHLALRFRPDVAVIGIGTNDTKKGGGSDAVNEFKDAYRDIVARFRAGGTAHIISQTPNGTLPTAPDHVVEHQALYAQTTRELSDELGTMLVDHYTVWEETPEGSWFHWLGHGCHPNAAGHLALARELFKALGIWDTEKSRVCRLNIP